MEKGEWPVYARRRSVAQYTLDAKPLESSSTASGARAACASVSPCATQQEGTKIGIAIEVTPTCVVFL